MGTDLNGIEAKDIRTYSALTLAYIGDAVFDLVIRSILVGKGNTPVNNLHKKASGIVKAQTQSDMVAVLMDGFTEEEKDVYKRGRNSKPHTKAKNATTSEYLEATGLEAVIGYLYLLGDMERVCDLISEGVAKLDISL